MRSPLADRLRPQNIDDIVGQHHLLDEGRPLRNIIESGQIPNMVFYGPSGVGKTTLASIIARKTNRIFRKLNGTTASTSDIKEIFSELDGFGGINGILLYLDEIQYFNKKQQQTLLEYIENGSITLIASTTENPYFYVYSAILSRSTVFEFKPVEKEDVIEAVKRGYDYLSKEENIEIDVEPKAAEHIAYACGGDVRKSMNAVELSVIAAKRHEEKIHITFETVSQLTQKSAVRYDKEGDEHYDLLSAFQKSMRGSDPDAAVYWLARMLESGEDPRFIARRILICACEDVGLAEPYAVMIAQAAFSAAEELGMPEVRIPLAHAAIYVACCPKSNSAYLAVDKALQEVREGRYRPVPDHLRSGMKNKGYKYAHDFKNHYVKQLYMPSPMKFFEPGTLGREAALIQKLKELKGE